MTDLMSRPVLRVGAGPSTPQQPSLLPAVAAAVAAAAVGLVACLLCAVAGWFAAGTGSFSGGVRAGALAWLISNGAGLHTRAAAITVVPLGAAMLAAWLLYRAGRWAGARSAVTSVRDAVRVTGALSAVYCLVSLAVALASRSPAAHAGLARTALATLLLVVPAGGTGVLRGSGRSSDLLGRLPNDAMAALKGAAAALATMLVAGSLLFMASLVAHISTAVNVAAGMHAGLVGGALLLLSQVCLLPNAAVFAGAFAAGPGFALGTGTAVAPGGVRLGPLPAFPLFAAVPHDVSAGWLQLLVVVPVCAGVIAGVVVVRSSPAAGSAHAAVLGALAGLSGGVAFALLCQLASGAVGPGRMQDVGPAVAATLLVCAVAGLLGGAVAGAGSCWVSSRTGTARRGPEPAQGSPVPAEGSPVSADESPVSAEGSPVSVEGSPASAE
jgi:hypothetical protein